MIFRVSFTFLISICKATMLLNSFSPSAPYLLDEKLEQSVVFKSMDASENEFQIEMADLLGLTERPRHIRKTLSLRKAASKFLLELYDTLQEEEEPQMSVYKKRVARSALISKEDRKEIDRCNNIITFSSKKRKTRRVQNGLDMTMTFNTNHIPRDLRLIRAELRMFQNSQLGRRFEGVRNVTVSVFHRVLNRKLGKLDRKLLSSLTTTTNYKGWLEANVTNIVSKWLFRGFTTNGHELIVTTTIHGQEQEQTVMPEDIGLINVSGVEEYQPFIIGFFNGPELLNKIQHLRFKRDMAGKVKRYTTSYRPPRIEGMLAFGESFRASKTCERMNFSIDFQDLQMQDWVIAPKKFEAYYCGGECNFPLGSKMNATNHAIVQTLMHLKEPSLPKPCCVPTVLSSVSILHYLNEDSVNLSKYPDSVAKSCGCH